MNDSPVSADAAPSPDDEVTARRARIRQLSATGKRLGYACIGLACVLFAVGVVTSVQPWMVPATAALFVLSGVFLVPATIAAYGVNAADREERAAHS